MIIKNKKILSIITAILVLTSCFSFSAFAENASVDTSVSEITPVVIWDMSNVKGNVIYDTTGENNLTALISNPGLRTGKSNNCIYSKPTVRGGYGAANWEYTIASKSNKNEKILDAFDSAFTFSTWIKLDEFFKNGKADASVFSIISSDNSVLSELYLAYQTGGNAKLTFKRSFETGKAWIDLGTTLENGKWYNIVISYNPEDPTKLLAIVNGEVVGTTQITNNSILSPSGNVKIHNETHEFYIGKTYTNMSYNLYGGIFGETAIYSGNITEAAAIELYNKNAGYFEEGADVRFYDMGGNLIEDLTKVKAEKNTVKIDFTGKNIDTSNDLYLTITNKENENEYVEFSGKWENEVYVISDFVLKDGESYNLTLYPISDKDGDSVLSGFFTLPFTCDDSSSSLKLIAKYEAKEQGTKKFNQWYNQVIIPNSAENSEIPSLTLNCFKTTGYEIKQNPKLANSYYAYSGENIYHMINSSELAKKLDDNFTYETYFRLDQSKDAVFVIGVGSDTDDNMRAYFASDGLWIFKRYDSTGFAYWQAPSAKIEVGKYYHLIIKFEENKLPVAYLNGVKCETKHSGGTYPTSFVPYSADKIENSKVHILNYTCGSGSTRPTATWAMSSFYEGVADAYDVYKMYESAKAKFENYGVTFKNASEESVTAENVADTNKVKASVTVTSSLTEPTVILAKYNGGKLTEIKFASKKGGANDEYVFETDLVDFSAGDTLKVLCWSDLGSLSPITAEDSTLTK